MVLIALDSTSVVVCEGLFMNVHIVLIKFYTRHLHSEMSGSCGVNPSHNLNTYSVHYSGTVARRCQVCLATLTATAAMLGRDPFVPHKTRREHLANIE